MTAALLIIALSAPWKAVAPGVEVAPAAELGGDASWAAKVVLVDPGKVHFLVRYDPSRPTLSEWRKRFPQAIAIVNGSFYSVEAASVRPTCDLVSEGVPMRGAGCHRQDALFFAARARPAPAVPASMQPSPQARLVAPAEFHPE